MVEHLKNSALPRAVTDVIGDLADLVQKELRLARTEVSEKLAAKLRAGVWLAVAGVFALMAAVFVLEGIVFGLTTLGIALHWACLIVAAGLAIIGAAAYAKGMADAKEELTPTRTLHQIKRDVATAKEQLT
jgi:hypothetical protein